MFIYQLKAMIATDLKPHMCHLLE